MNLRLLGSATLIGAASLSMAHTVIYQGTFSGLNENPPNASPGTGFAQVVIDTDTLMMTLDATWSGMTGTVTASHIHVAATPGANGGVATQTPTFPGFPNGVSAGTYHAVFDLALASSYNSSFITANGGTVSGALTALMNGLNEERAYWNIHSTTFGGGELRANLRAVPEPATMTALAVGVAALLRRRRQG